MGTAQNISFLLQSASPSYSKGTSFRRCRKRPAPRSIQRHEREPSVVEPDLHTSLRRLDTVQLRRQRAAGEDRAVVGQIDDREMQVSLSLRASKWSKLAMMMTGHRQRESRESVRVRVLKLKKQLLIRKAKAKYGPRDKSRKPKVG